MFDVASLILGIIIGSCGGIAAVTLVAVNRQYDDDDPEYWFKQLGRRSSDRD